MRRILHDLKILILTNLWIVPVIAGLVGALFYFAAPPPPMHARMATGAVGGGYHAFGERLQAELELQGFSLELFESAGSEDNLGKLGSGEVELALVQSGQELTLSDEARGKLEPAQFFHEVLVHRWYLSERAGRPVDIFDTARDYIDNVLGSKPEEALAADEDPTSDDTDPARISR